MRPPGVYALYQEVAVRHRLDDALVAAVVDVESQHNHRAVAVACLRKYKGKDKDCARGLMQIKPSTALAVCKLRPEELYNKRKNLDCGTRYLARLLKKYPLKRAIGSYYAGARGYLRLGGLNNKEIFIYVNKVLARRNYFSNTVL